MKPKIILTFDIENWFDSRFLEKYLKDPAALNSCIEESIELILNKLNRHQATATFFILGKIAAKHPETIKKIYQSGHEIASHGYSHKYLENLSPEDFEKEIKETNHLLADLTGTSPKGFRAPAFSLNQKTSWALKILKENGFQYDSSLFPINIGLYGDQLGRLAIPEGLIELPVAVYHKSFFKLPLAGGVYFRFLPYWIFRFFLRLMAKKEIPVIYFHNHELLPVKIAIPGCPFWKKWLKFKGVKNNYKKFEKLLQDFDCLSIKDSMSNK